MKEMKFHEVARVLEDEYEEEEAFEEEPKRERELEYT